MMSPRLSEIHELFPDIGIRRDKVCAESSVGAKGSATRLTIWCFGNIGRDSPSRSATGAELMQALAGISTSARMILMMVSKNAAIFATHGAMLRASATLWQGVLVM